jgi:crotonobetainyl-CoA:carnitine CoA-transferase CaiB-like acyl-CoA transferase
MTSISNFGQTGPYRDYEAEEITEYAMSGLMSLTGDPARPPLSSGPTITQKTAGLHAYIASLLALFRRGEEDAGEYIDISIQESVMENIEIALVEYLQQKKSARRKDDQHPLVPWQVFPCQDGYAAVIGGPIRNWLQAVELFQQPRLADEKFRHMSGRIKHRDEFVGLLMPWLSAQRKKEIYHGGQARRLAFGYLATLAEVWCSEQHEARGFFSEVKHPAVGEQKYCGEPFRPSETPWESKRAPLLGEHNEEVYGNLLGSSLDDLRRLSGKGVI